MVAIEGWKTATSVSQCLSKVGIVVLRNIVIPCTCTVSLGIALYIQRSVAKVEWSAGGPANIYRVGHKGKVMSLCARCTHFTCL